MGFITFPCNFTDEEENDKAENLKIKPRKVRRNVRLNTNQISTFKETDKKHTEITMANNDVFVLEINVDDFDEIINEVDNFFDITPNAN